MFKNVLPVHSRLVERGFLIDSVSCPLCNLHLESISHALIHCPNVQNLWHTIQVMVRFDDVLFDVWFIQIVQGSKLITKVKCCFVLWQIWNARNQLIFIHKHWNATDILFVSDNRQAVCTEVLEQYGQHVSSNCNSIDGHRWSYCA